jgi:hypothetical protein
VDEEDIPLHVKIFREDERVYTDAQWKSLTDWAKDVGGEVVTLNEG